MCVYDSNSFFTRSRPLTRPFFATHFLICHSFLDSFIRPNLARKAKGEDLAGKGPGKQRFHSRTVAQSHSTLSLRPNHDSILVTCHKPISVTCHNQPRSHVTIQSRSHVTTNLGHMSQPNLGHMSQPSSPPKNHENCPAFNFPLCCKKIEMKLAPIIKCSAQFIANEYQLWKTNKNNNKLPILP